MMPWGFRPPFRPWGWPGAGRRPAPRRKGNNSSDEEEE